MTFWNQVELELELLHSVFISRLPLVDGLAVERDESSPVSEDSTAVARTLTAYSNFGTQFAANLSTV